MAKGTTNRWFVAVAAVIMQLSLGAAYGWSVFVKPLATSEQWSLPAVSFTFSLAIFCLGIGTIIGGAWQDRVGPRVVASVAGLLYGAGYFVAAYAVNAHSLTGVYLGYGVIGGFGMGMGYICPVATLVKWFPEKRGLMTGIAVCGYGMGALLMSAIAVPQIASNGVAATFVLLGLGYMLAVIASAQFFTNPPQSRSVQNDLGISTDYTTAQALRTGTFWVLWIMIFVNVSAGIMIISQASPMAQQIAGLSASAAAAVVGIIAVLNGLGRVVCAAASDRFGRPQVFIVLFALLALLFWALPTLHSPIAFTSAVAMVGFAYGGAFGTMPALVAEQFGARNIGGIYGAILLAWGIGAVPSPMLMAYVRQVTGQYSTAIYLIAVAVTLCIALPVSLYRRQSIQTPRFDSPPQAELEQQDLVEV